jgi:hypothetical protein
MAVVAGSGVCDSHRKEPAKAQRLAWIATRRWPNLHRFDLRRFLTQYSPAWPTRFEVLLTAALAIHP